MLLYLQKMASRKVRTGQFYEFELTSIAQYCCSKATPLETKYKLKMKKVLLDLDGNVSKYDILFQETTVM